MREILPWLWSVIAVWADILLIAAIGVGFLAATALLLSAVFLVGTIFYEVWSSKWSRK